MKKQFLLACSLVAAFALSSCNGNSNANQEATDTTSVADTTANDTAAALADTVAPAADTVAAPAEDKVEKAANAVKAVEKAAETAKNNYDALIEKYKACVAKYNETKATAKKGDMKAIGESAELLQKIHDFQKQLKAAKGLTVKQTKEIADITESVAK